MTDIATSQVLICGAGTLLLDEAHHAGDQCPEAQDRLRTHDLIVVAAEQVFLVFEEGLDLPTNRQNIDQRLSG